MDCKYKNAYLGHFKEFKLKNRKTVGNQANKSDQYLSIQMDNVSN